jgi:hypothetical protein
VPRAGAQPADTLRFSLAEAVTRALDVSPEVAEVDAQRQFSVARYDFARANRFLTEFRLTTAHAIVPGLDNPNDTPTDELYLDPDVRNDWGSLRMFNQVEASLVQPILTWGELKHSIAAASKAPAARSHPHYECEDAYKGANMFEVLRHNGIILVIL